MGITGSLKKDILLMMVPSWLLIILYLNYSELFYNSVTAWFIIMFFQLLEIMHELSTLPRVLNYESRTFKKNLKYFFLVIIAVIAIIGLVHYLGFIFFFLLLLPLSLFHHTKQTTGILKWYFHINKRYCSGSISFYLLNYACICLLVLSEGFKHVPLPFSINSQLSSYVLFSLILINILRFGYELFLFLKYKNIEWNRIVYLNHTMIVSAILILVSKDYIWGYIFIIFDHCVQYLVVSTKARLKLNKHYEIPNYKTKIIISLLFLAIVSLLLNFYDFKLNYIYDYANKVLNTGKGVNISMASLQNNFLLSFLIGISYVPLFLHYFYDLFLWKKNNIESTIVFSNKDS